MLLVLEAVVRLLRIEQPREQPNSRWANFPGLVGNIHKDSNQGWHEDRPQPWLSRQERVACKQSKGGRPRKLC
jgi:hypothetical protein